MPALWEYRQVAPGWNYHAEPAIQADGALAAMPEMRAES